MGLLSSAKGRAAHPFTAEGWTLAAGLRIAPSARVSGKVKDPQEWVRAVEKRWAALGRKLQRADRQEPLGAHRPLVVRQRHRPDLEPGAFDERQPGRAGEQAAHVLVVLDANCYA
jgi:hypothetical protein